MQTHDVGRLFVHPISLEPGSSRLHRCVTQEIERPYRRSRSVAVRLAGRRGLVIGWWQPTDLTEDEALVQALAIREMPIEGVIDWQRPGRRDVAA